jgi:hypothetical protein
LLDVIGKNGDNFDGQIVALRQIGGHEKGDAILLGERNPAPQGDISLSGRELVEGGLHGFDNGRHWQSLANLGRI